MEMTNQSNPSKYNNNKIKKKNQTPFSKFRFDLDNCTKRNDLHGAISLYESANSLDIRLNQHHINSFLYICSNSASDSSAIEYGFRIFDHMLTNGVLPNEATITAVARLAVAKGDGDLAFELVKDLGKYKALPKIRSYCPALFCFCKKLEAEKAYSVEEHMNSVGLQAEEPELAALLKVSVDCGRQEKVYAYLHKLRGALRCVSDSTSEIIEGWFEREMAEVVGLEDWDEVGVKELALKNGGGWHGFGWLGKGKWVVKRSSVDSSGFCCSCKEQLVCVDIDRVETEKFAQSVASLAMKREVQSNFTEFQNWLDEHSEYEAIVDGANIGLYQQNFAEGGFSMSQLEAVVKELYNRSKKWPLVVLHSKRIRTLLENSANRQLIEKWMNEEVLYGTPFGSNDDWYWLYAAVKLKCLIVTNDEMRDHIFELLGSSFFLKWKERHQVRYTFVKSNLKLQMPPSYSLVIQESVNGAWHVPIAGDVGDESSRTWLCITRLGSHKKSDEITAKSSETTQFPVNPINGGSHSIPSSNSNNTAVRGKRKERSPSPSEP
ncbi:hypothetical protein LguiA_021327 [Lonicera macranthoides]